jgi:hypothetical protein
MYLDARQLATRTISMWERLAYGTFSDFAYVYCMKVYVSKCALTAPEPNLSPLICVLNISKLVYDKKLFLDSSETLDG